MNSKAGRTGQEVWIRGCVCQVGCQGCQGRKKVRNVLCRVGASRKRVIEKTGERGKRGRGRCE